MRFLVLVMMLIMSGASGVFAVDRTGRAHVVDGDTIDIGGVRFRLEGIDAFESAQKCRRADGVTWRCGKEATRAMQSLVKGKTVSCIGLGSDGRGREIAICSVGAVDLGAEMITSGLAFPFLKYSNRYEKWEFLFRDDDRLSRLLGDFTYPWDYRANGWANAAQGAPDPNCRIKGNISGSGRIYHMPHFPDYNKTRIDTSKGERWFCDEAEARNAGWRAPRNL